MMGVRLKRPQVLGRTPRQCQVGVGAGDGTDRLIDGAPSGGIDGGSQAGDVGDEGNTKRRGAGWPAARGGLRSRAGPAGTGLDQQQKTENENYYAGGQVPKRRSP